MLAFFYSGIYLFIFIFLFLVLGNTDISNSFGTRFDTPVDKPIEFNNPFIQQTHASSTPNLFDDILTPETPGNIATTPTDNHNHDGRLTGDLNKGLERVALSLGVFCFVFYFHNLY